jgi:dipeptidase E
MRLFLSSYKAGDYPDKLVELFGKKAKVAVITNAKDDKNKKERKESVDEVIEFLSAIGFKAEEIDLRRYFKESSFSEKELQKYQAVWITGGNTFVLARAMVQSGARNVLGNMVRKNEIVYGGESAGAILATPTLTGVEFGDDPEIIPKAYDETVATEGLNLISYHIVPHYKSAWDGAEDMVNELKKKKLTYNLLTDNQAIVINGDKEEFLK